MSQCIAPVTSTVLGTVLPAVKRKSVEPAATLVQAGKQRSRFQWLRRTAADGESSWGKLLRVRKKTRA